MCYWKKESVLPLKEGTDVLDDFLFLDKAVFCEWAKEGQEILSPRDENCRCFKSFSQSIGKIFLCTYQYWEISTAMIDVLCLLS